MFSQSIENTDYFSEASIGLLPTFKTPSNTQKRKPQKIYKR